MLRRLFLSLALTALFAPTILAQEEANRVYVAYYQVGYGDLGQWIADYQEHSVPVLQALVDEGMINGFGAQMHNTGGEYNFRQALRGNASTDWEAFWAEYFARSMERSPEAIARGNEMIQAHEDEIWNIEEVVMAEEGAPFRYMYDTQFVVSFANLEAWNAMYAEVITPALQEALEQGILAGWVIESHNTGGRFNWKNLLLFNDWDDIDDAQTMFFEAAGLDHPIWGLFSAHKDELWEALPPAGN